MFVHNYFLYVHPFLPLLDEARFWQEYRLFNVHRDGISILLFHAMLFAASCVSESLDHGNMISYVISSYQWRQLNGVVTTP